MRTQTISTLLTLLVAVLIVAAVPAKAGDGPLVIVPRDVDVYAQAGGAGQPVGQLAGGSKVRLATKGDDHWCKVYGDGVPGGEGWVWCGIGDDGQDYALTEAPAEPAPAPAPVPVKRDCQDFGPNEGSAGGAADPKLKYECEPLPNGYKRCCWVQYP